MEYDAIRDYCLLTWYRSGTGTVWNGNGQEQERLGTGTGTVMNGKGQERELERNGTELERNGKERNGHGNGAGTKK